MPEGKKAPRLISQRLPVKVCVCQYMSLLLRIPVTCSYCRLNFLFMGIRFREDLISRVFKGSLIAYNRQKREIKDRRIVKYQQGVRITTKDCKGPQTNMPKNVGSIKTWSAKIASRHIKFCNVDRTEWKLTLQDINTTPKELKGDRSHRRLFCVPSVFRKIYPNEHEATLAG